MQVIKLTVIDKLILVLKMVIGSAISWELAILFGSKYPYLGPISLILCIQATLLKSIRFGVARMIRYDHWSIICLHSRLFSSCKRIVHCFCHVG